MEFFKIEEIYRFSHIIAKSESPFISLTKNPFARLFAQTASQKQLPHSVRPFQTSKVPMVFWQKCGPSPPTLSQPKVPNCAKNTCLAAFCCSLPFAFATRNAIHPGRFSEALKERAGAPSQSFFFLNAPNCLLCAKNNLWRAKNEQDGVKDGHNTGNLLWGTDGREPEKVRREWIWNWEC